MARFDRRELQARLMVKREALVREQKDAEAAKVVAFNEWKQGQIELQTESVAHSKALLAAAKVMAYGDPRKEDPCGGIYIDRPYGRVNLYRPAPGGTPVNVEAIEAVDKALTELDLMVEDIISLTSRNFLNLL